MAELTFDDLIPKKPAANGVSFDDIVPAESSAAEPDKQGWLPGVVDAFTQGATFGFGDEITAGEAAVLGKTPEGGWFDYSRPIGERYDRALEAERAQNDQFRKDNLVSSTAAEIAGAVIAPGAPLRAVKSGNVFARAAKSAGIAGVEGGVYGFGAGEGGFDERAESAVEAAKWAGMIGAGATGVGALGQILLDKVASRFRAPAAEAVARVRRAAKGTGASADDVVAKLDDLGPEGMLVDALGEPGRALARSASNANPAAREALEMASSARLAGQPDRMTEALLRAGDLDAPRTMDDLINGIRAETGPAINKAYEDARSLGYDIDLKSFGDLFQSDIAMKALKDGHRLARERMIAEAARKGTVDKHVLANGPSNLAILDETKKVLDGFSRSAPGAKPTNEQAIAGMLAQNIRNRIDAYMPEYGGARDLARNAKIREEALELGASGAKPFVPADFGPRVSAADPTHKPDIAKAYVSGLIDRINNRRTTPGAMDAIFGSRRQQDALGIALGENAKSVRTQLARERAFNQTDRALKGNSTTARQLLEMGAIPGAGAGLGLFYGGDAQSGGIGALIGLAARRGGSAALKAISGKREAAVAPKIAELLTGHDLPKEVVEAIQKSPTMQRLFLEGLARRGARTVGAF